MRFYTAISSDNHERTGVVQRATSALHTREHVKLLFGPHQPLFALVKMRLPEPLAHGPWLWRGGKARLTRQVTLDSSSQHSCRTLHQHHVLRLPPATLSSRPYSLSPILTCAHRSSAHSGSTTTMFSECKPAASLIAHHPRHISARD